MSLKKSKTDKPLLVVGDAILDVYRFGEQTKDSEGVPKFCALEEKISWGGAGLLVRNLLELGKKVIFVSIIGDDAWGNREKELVHKNLKKIFITEPKRKSVVKERFISDDKKILKWNTLEIGDIKQTTERQILSALRKCIIQCESVIISDYRHGMITAHLASRILTLAKSAQRPVFVDSQVSQKESNHLLYKGADAFCLNEMEAICVDENFSLGTLRDSLSRLSNALVSNCIVVKLGEEGSAAFIKRTLIKTPAHKVKAVDPCGAGDAFLAALASRGFPPDKDALRFANFWAALSTTIVGVEPPKYKKYKYVRH